MNFNDSTAQKSTNTYKPTTKATRPTMQATRTSSTPPTRPNRKGVNNPFYGHSHSLESRQKQSETQKARYQAIRNQLEAEGKTINESLTAIIKREIQRIIKDARD